MSQYIQVFRDVEESLSREVRRITFDDNRSITRVVLQDTFDPFTGQLMKVPIEPSFYDSSSDANNIQYPEFFIKLIKTREDRFTKREVPLYGHQQTTNVLTSPKGFEIVLDGSDGTITSPGNLFQTSVFNIRKVQPNFLLRLLNGNNKGTYIISSITINNSGLHSIFLNNNLVINLPSIIFDTNLRKVLFSNPTDLSTVAAGDQFQDSLGTIFSIISVDTNAGSIVIGGVATPSLAAGGFIFRTGNVLKNADLSLVRFIIMDPSKPVMVAGLEGSSQANTSIEAVNWPVPIDAFYLIRIDSKERATHIDILNRIWDEFNPPRTGLPIIVRSSLSADILLSADITTGGSSTVNVTDNSVFNIGDPVFIFDNFTPTRDAQGNFERPFTSKVVSIGLNNQLVLADIVPDTYIVANGARIVSNAEFNIWMFHFVDHNTKDVESAQYWVHEFTFWIQVWVERQGLPEALGVITNIETPISDIDGNIIIDDT